MLKKVEVCPKCNISLLCSHRGLRWWVECNSCRFCKFDLEFLDPNDHEKALAKPNQEISPTHEEFRAVYAHMLPEMVPWSKIKKP